MQYVRGTELSDDAKQAIAHASRQAGNRMHERMFHRHDVARLTLLKATTSLPPRNASQALSATLTVTSAWSPVLGALLILRPRTCITCGRPNAQIA